MPAGARRISTGKKTVWTNRSTTVALNHALTAALSTNSIVKARAAYTMDERTTDIKFRPIYRVSNDGITWDAWVVMHAGYRNANGTDYPNAWVDVSGSGKLFIQFGVEVLNETGTTLEFCNATLDIDVRDAT